MSGDIKAGVFLEEDFLGADASVFIALKGKKPSKKIEAPVIPGKSKEHPSVNGGRNDGFTGPFLSPESEI